MKKIVGIALAVLVAVISAFAAESISITATPRYPWNGKVDLKFTIDGTSGTKYSTSFTAKDVGYWFWLYGLFGSNLYQKGVGLACSNTVVFLEKFDAICRIFGFM